MTVKVTSLHEHSSRYTFDMGLCSVKNGYAQVDSGQDAWYYGTWANPTERKIVCYCEGDIDITECDTDEEFYGAMRRLVEWNIMHGFSLRNGKVIGIDPGFSNTLKQAFVDVGLGDLLH